MMNTRIMAVAIVLVAVCLLAALSTSLTAQPRGDKSCGDPNASTCFQVHPDPFCDDEDCCVKVCDNNPSCCDTAWDETCVAWAQVLCASLYQSPNQNGGIFSDTDCDFCDMGPIQILAENFNVPEGPDRSIGSVTVWGGYFPDDLPPGEDHFTVEFYDDDNGFPGLLINSQNLGCTQTPTGEILFGVTEYEVDCELDEVPLNSGSFWLVFYGNTSRNTDSFFWVTGDLDRVHGKPGIASRFDFPPTPGGGWFFEKTIDLAIALFPPDPCPWDLDGSGSVGAADLLDLLFNWGPCPGCAADFDGDDIVGASDLLAMLFNWGPCP